MFIYKYINLIIYLCIYAYRPLTYMFDCRLYMYI